MQEDWRSVGAGAGTEGVPMMGSVELGLAGAVVDRSGNTVGTMGGEGGVVSGGDWVTVTISVAGGGLEWKGKVQKARLTI